jgi:hypothetical protein
MTSLITQPQLMATAAADMAKISSAIGAAKSAAAGPTTGVVAAAADEVSAASARLFGTYAQEYQAILNQATAFHNEFAAAVASAGSAYTAAEAANAATISGALGRVTSPIQSLLGGAPAAPAPAPAAPMLPTPTLPTLTTPITGLFMGGSGLPIPTTRPGYMQGVLNWVNFNGVNTLPLSHALPLFTPEGLYPLTGVKTLPLDTSVSQGVTILESAINQQLFPTVGTASPSVAVLGYSQSAIISSEVMQNLLNGTYPGTVPLPSQLGFTLLGDPMNPNGGILARFGPATSATSPTGQPIPGLTLPSLGLDFYGATPQATPYGTSIYTLQYDGYADFPRYPINFVSDLNAFLGLETVHGTYPSIDPSHLPAGDQMTLLPGSVDNPAPGGVASVATNYYMITQPGLPLVAPLRAIPIIGNPLADLLQPDLTTIVNLGYGDPNFGYSTAPANLPTPFGLFPHVSQALIAQDLVTGAQQGVSAFSADIQAELPVAGSSLSLSSIGHALSTAGTGGFSLPTGLASALSSPDSFIEALQTANTNITNAITNVAANSYSVLLPTADIANAVFTSIPSYDVNLVLSGVEQMVNGDLLGGLQYAVVAPIAADTALLTLAGGFELIVVLNGVEGAIGSL